MLDCLRQSQAKASQALDDGVEPEKIQIICPRCCRLLGGHGVRTSPQYFIYIQLQTFSGSVSRLRSLVLFVQQSRGPVGTEILTLGRRKQWKISLPKFNLPQHLQQLQNIHNVYKLKQE